MIQLSKLALGLVVGTALALTSYLKFLMNTFISPGGRQTVRHTSRIRPKYKIQSHTASTATAGGQVVQPVGDV